MKWAAADFWVWLIIVAFMAIAKGWSKFAAPSGDDEQPQPPIDLSKPQSKRPPRPQPAPQAARPRPQVPPRTLRPMASVPRRGRPSPRIDKSSGAWRVDAEKIREFIEKMQQGAAPAVPPVAPAPTPAPPPPRKTTKPAPVPAPTQTSTSDTKPASPGAAPSRATQWAAALRDRQNIRNIIISAEIIGPPRGA